MAPSTVELVAWMPEWGPKMQPPVVTLLHLVPAQSLCKLCELHGKFISVGQCLCSIFLWAVISSGAQLGWTYLEKCGGCRAPWSIAVLQRRGCVMWEQSLFFLFPTPITSTALSTSAVCSCVDLATSPWPRFEVGIIYPWWRWSTITQEEPRRAV